MEPLPPINVKDEGVAPDDGSVPSITSHAEQANEGQDGEDCDEDGNDRFRVGYVIFDKTLDDVEISEEATNAIDLKKGNKKFSKLKSIAGYSIQGIKLDDLRSFCTHNKIKGIRRMKKDEICSTVVYVKEKYDLGEDPVHWNFGLTAEKKIDMNESVGLLKEIVQLDQGPSHDQDPGTETKKRRREDTANNLFETSQVYASLGEGGEDSLPSFPVGSRKHATLQKEIAKSIMNKNNATQLKELVNAASETLSNIREEKRQRKELLKEFAEWVGGERVAREMVRTANTQVLDNENGSNKETSDDINSTEEWQNVDWHDMAKHIVQQDDLIKLLYCQHAALSDKIMKHAQY